MKACMLALAALALMAGQHGARQVGAQPASSVDFFVEVAAAGCNTDAGPATCNVPVGSRFTVGMHLKSFSGLPDTDADTTSGYVGFRGGLDNSAGLTRIDTPGLAEIVWPDCPPGDTLEFYAVDFGVGCQTGGLFQDPPESTFTGLMMNVVYECGLGPSVEAVTMVHAEPYGTSILDGGGSYVVDTDPNETLTINCLEPLPTPSPTASATPTSRPSVMTPPSSTAAPPEPTSAVPAPALPPTGTGAGSGSASFFGPVVAVFATAIALGGAAWYARRRRHSSP